MKYERCSISSGFKEMDCPLNCLVKFVHKIK